MIRSESDSGGQSEIGQLQMTDIELSKSRNSIHSHNSSSSKASTGKFFFQKSKRCPKPRVSTPNLIFSSKFN